MRNTERVEFANALRGIAALSVIVSHYLGVFWTAPAAVTELTGLSFPPVSIPAFARWTQIPHFNWGAFGVALFFLVSGFVIPFSFRTYGRLGFLVGRFFRLFPTYWLGLTVSMITVIIGCHFFGAPFPHSRMEVLTGYALGLRDVMWIKSVDGIVWTLEIEIKFYLICTLIAPWLRDGSLKSFIAPIVLFALIMFLGEWLLTATTTMWNFLAFSAPYILFMFIGVAFNFRFRRKISAGSATLLIVCLIGMFTCGLNFGFFKAPSLVLSYIAAIAVFATAYRLPKLFSQIPAINFWADISYPLYVVHAVIGYVLMTAMTTIGAAPSATVAAALCMTTAAAFLLHKYVERPTHRLGQRIASRIRPNLFTSALNDSNAGLQLTPTSEESGQYARPHPYHPGDVVEPAELPGR